MMYTQTHAHAYLYDRNELIDVCTDCNIHYIKKKRIIHIYRPHESKRIESGCSSVG